MSTKKHCFTENIFENLRLSKNASHIISNSELKQYLSLGWQNLTKMYFDNKHCPKKDKICTNKNKKSVSQLIILGAIRQLIINELFNCAKKNLKLSDSKDTIVNFGSSNITSDYDVTILGKNSAAILDEMITEFKRYANQTLDSALDSNIYTIGYFGKHGFNRNIPGVLEIYTDDNKETDIVALQSPTKKAKNIEMIFAMLKIYEADPDILKSMINERTYNIVVETSQNLNKSIGNITENSSKYYHAKYDRLNVITQLLFNKYLYSTKKKFTDSMMNHIFSLINKGSWASYEAYYTLSSVNVVVLEIQGEHKFRQNGRFVKLDRINYKCAAMENFGDFVKKIKTKISSKATEQELKTNLLKFSKYLYRIWYCLYKLKPKYHYKYVSVKNNMYTHVSKANTDMVKWEIIFSHKGSVNYTNLMKYIDYLKTIIYNECKDTIDDFSHDKPQKLKVANTSIKIKKRKKSTNINFKRKAKKNKTTQKVTKKAKTHKARTRKARTRKARTRKARTRKARTRKA
jgi:hypothetical protein